MGEDGPEFGCEGPEFGSETESTLVEIVSEDRPGLLYDLASAISDQGLQHRRGANQYRGHQGPGLRHQVRRTPYAGARVPTLRRLRIRRPPHLTQPPPQ